MRASFLAILMIALLPGIALAHPPAPAEPDCGSAHASLPDGDRCLSGSILFMGDSFLAVRPPHGSLKLVMATNDTTYRTNSGAAALEGLVQGDFVCVAGYDEANILVADVVTFDVHPFSCDR